MSKIYEALRRAETDRIKPENDPSNAVHGPVPPLPPPEHPRPTATAELQRPATTPERPRPPIPPDPRFSAAAPDLMRPAAPPDLRRPATTPEHLRPATPPEVQRPAASPDLRSPAPAERPRPVLPPDPQRQAAPPDLRRPMLPEQPRPVMPPEHAQPAALPDLRRPAAAPEPAMPRVPVAAPPDAMKAAGEPVRPTSPVRDAVPTRWTPDRRVLLALNQRGMEVEQIRGLRARVHELRHYNPELKVIQICSAVSGEGKSFTAANLAVSLANYKSSPVLLIDGDMRRGTLHKILGAPSEPGLTHYLSGSAGLSEILQKPSAEWTNRPDMQGLNSLSFIPYGRDAENAADLSGNGSFKRLLAAVRDRYDWIIVDSSPVNLVADGVNLARVVDGVLLVMRAGVTRYEMAQRTLAELRAANVLGAVFNAVQDMKPTGGYYGY